MALLLSDNGGATFKADALKILFWIFTIVDALLVGYAVYIAFLFATATDAAKRTAAKSRLIKVFSSLLCIIALTMTLKAIDINFDPVQGNLNNDKTILEDQSQVGLIYVDPINKITLTEDPEQFFSIRLTVDGFRTLTQQPIDESKFEFIDFKFEYGTVFNEVDPFGKNCYLSPRKEQLIYSLKISNANYWGPPKNIKVYYRFNDEMEVLKSCVRGEASVNYDGKQYTVNCFIPFELNTKDNLHPIYLFPNAGTLPNYV